MEIETGQVWVRKFGEDQLTILEDVIGPDDEYEIWHVLREDGDTLHLSANYISAEFEYQSEHPNSVTFTDRDDDTLDVRAGAVNPANVVFTTSFGVDVVLRPDDIDALMHWLKTHRTLHRND